MSESTPLLPQISRPPRDYSVFYRVCHSPWPFIPPKALLAARMSLAVFVSVVLILDLVYDITYAGTGKVYVFRLSHIGLFIQLLYFFLTSVCPESHSARWAPLINVAVVDLLVFWRLLYRRRIGCKL